MVVSKMDLEFGSRAAIGHLTLWLNLAEIRSVVMYRVFFLVINAMAIPAHI